MNRIQLFRLSKNKISFNRLLYTMTITPVDGFHYERNISMSDPCAQVLELVAQRSVENEKNRGYMLIRFQLHGSLIVNELLYKYASLPSDYHATTWQEWPTKDKVLMLEYTWKCLDASTLEENRKLDRVKLLVNGPKLDDFDRCATKCLYNCIHSQ